jgi:hypothetical protein
LFLIPTRPMAATIIDEDRIEGAWSSNRGFVTVTEDYIKHDIYIMKMSADLMMS